MKNETLGKERKSVKGGTGVNKGTDRGLKGETKAPVINKEYQEGGRGKKPLLIRLETDRQQSERKIHRRGPKRGKRRGGEVRREGLETQKSETAGLNRRENIARTSKMERGKATEQRKRRAIQERMSEIKSEAKEAYRLMREGIGKK